MGLFLSCSSVHCSTEFSCSCHYKTTEYSFKSSVSFLVYLKPYNTITKFKYLLSHFFSLLKLKVKFINNTMQYVKNKYREFYLCKKCRIRFLKGKIAVFHSIYIKYIRSIVSYILIPEYNRNFI